MRIYYKGVLCNLATYRVMGEDRPALYPVDFSEEEIFYREFNGGFWHDGGYLTMPN